MQSFGVQCTNTSTSLCICLCASVRFSVSFVRFDSFYRWHNLYAHTGCVCALCMHYDRHSKNGWDDGVVYALCRSFLTLKYPASLLAYRNPKSHFMHRRFESKCSIFPLSRCPASHHILGLSFHLYISISRSIKIPTNSSDAEWNM